MHYQMLPHARPGGIAGLLELLIDYNGRADIYRLADDLAFEIDDLLPIVDAAHLWLSQGRRGRCRDHSGWTGNTPNRKSCCRRTSSGKPRSRMCSCCGRSPARSNTKSDHTVPEEFFLDMLDEQFSADETLRQLETAISWGRYAELFDFDASRRRFILPEEEETPEAVGEAEAE